MSDRTAIHCHGISKRFNGASALDGLELEVPAGAILALLGPSGCGKTTALRVIAGFEHPDSGRVDIAGLRVVDADLDMPPERRRVGMVFQEYALFPHMTVADNVAYGLDRSATGRVLEVLELVGLAEHGKRMPHELSGGEQQRVALARALAPKPAVILMDEPFSNLDAGLRDRMRRDVRAILKEAETTTVFVTHDQEEALAIADIVAVMRAGRVVQVGPPQHVYRRPASPWIARFVGESEFLDGVAAVGQVETPLGTFPQFGDLRGPVQVMIRPEWVHPIRSDDGVARVVDREFYGHDQLLVLELEDGHRLAARTGSNTVVAPGDRVDIGIDEVVVFPPAAG
ncbi:MAG TPA: ABC transporter ATP-binding protein [Acidimicrobiia bacterium]|jgi:iron(III) transport system ATP-binding protein|nr:ABC transporter ATP-binding protein [Acidimicrobiia bacterium]